MRLYFKIQLLTGLFISPLSLMCKSLWFHVVVIYLTMCFKVFVSKDLDTNSVTWNERKEVN